MGTGYVVLGDSQFYRGYTLFLAKEHTHELHEQEQVAGFLFQMAEVAAAVCRAFKPKKLNYELLGNSEPHPHWHLTPRYEDDPRPTEPIWVIDKSIRDQPVSDELLVELKEELLKELNG